MASLNAIAVANDVVRMVEKGLKVNIGSLVKKHGYSDSVSKNTQKVTLTKSFQNIVNNATKKMETVRSKALTSLEKKDFNNEKVPVLLSTVDVMTKNVQLLTGKSTENLALNIQISEAIANKYADVSSNSEKPTSDDVKSV